ncbi:MAG TPA: alpha/beta fold hydrolase [Chlamydiales bacterium]|nr:alpha/beta fold hydrolase [Chlamydiales bacterium]
MPNTIYLHGFLGSREDFASFPGPAINLPGHGGVPLPEVVSFDSICEYLAGKISRCTLVGYSLGGRIALHFAKKYPERVEKLILISAHPGLRDENEKKKRFEIDQKWAQLLREKPLEEFLKKWYDQPLFATLNIEEMIHRRKNQNPKDLEKILLNLSLAKQESFWDRIDSSTMIAGEKDEKFAALYRSIPGHILLPCGHAPHLECPNLLRDVICGKK